MSNFDEDFEDSLTFVSSIGVWRKALKVMISYLVLLYRYYDLLVS